MAVSTVQEFTGPNLELDEFYAVKIVSADEVENKFGSDPRVNLVCQLIDENRRPITDDDGRPVQAFCYVNVGSNSGKRSKLYQIWNAIFYDGKGIPEGEVMDTDELVNKYARIYWGMVANPQDKTEKPGVVRFAALKGAKPAAAAAKAKAVEDEIDAI